jgi:hypothetical protein
MRDAQEMNLSHLLGARTANRWTGRGRQPRTTHGQHPALSILTSMLKIYPERDPQKGQRGSSPSRWRAITVLKVVIEYGLCRSGRRRRTARPEAFRRLGDV